MPAINRNGIIAVIIGIGLLLIFIFWNGFYQSGSITQKEVNKQITSEVEVVSTAPDKLDQATILPTQTIEITFNYPIENTGEFKHSIDPKADYELKLSDDRTTVKVIPIKPYQLGQGYTFRISKETKFDNQKRLENDINFGFRTIGYSGV